MTRQFASIGFATFLIALWSTECPAAQARQPCSATMPSNPQGHWWSYRLVDGRKCWYEGKPGLSKSLLEWPNQTTAQPASGEETTSSISEKTRTTLDSQAWAPKSQASAPTDTETFETRWRARAAIEIRAPPEEGTLVPDERPAKSEIDDVPPLRKADRLQSTYLDRGQAKPIRTLVTIPDPPHSAGGLK